MTGPLPAKWATDLLRRIPPEDRGAVIKALREIADDLLAREPRETTTDLREVLVWTARAQNKVVVETPGNGGELHVFRHDYEDGPHSVLVVVYVVQEQLDYAVLLYFDIVD